jgi:hypothetical protein
MADQFLLNSFFSVVIAGQSFEKGGAGDGDTVRIDFDNDLITATATKDGGVVFAYNVAGKLGVVTFRVTVGSTYDQFFQGKFNQAKENFTGKIIIPEINLARGLSDASDDSGQAGATDYITLKGCVVPRQASIAENVNGTPSMMEWRISASSMIRSIQ